MVDILNRWLNDPTKGKVCIFAHHLYVLDSIRERAGLSNDEGSRRRFIRIDGSTRPRSRQEQIKAFQSDPSVRVALLGITAAGVAVTLTASSTVWFAELFWTPAIMIQAEDRCHRIGQQSRVKCLYVVARGTLDDILWKLIEKKFQDLGEFVEGKEKLKLVVDNTYGSVQELHSMFQTDESADDELDSLYFTDGDILDDELQLDGVMEHDIEELGKQETEMLRLSYADDEEPDPLATQGQKMPAVESAPQSSLGQSQDDAISLSDDDDACPTIANDDDNGRPADRNPRQEGLVKSAEATVGELQDHGSHDHSQAPKILDGRTPGNFTFYRITFLESKLGFEVTMVNRRLVVANVSPERVERWGAACKPCIGDIIAAVNNMPLPLTNNMRALLNLIEQARSRGPVDLVFAAEPAFTFYCKLKFENSRSNVAAAMQAPAPAKSPPRSSVAHDVIELIDDDED